jgi:hypothetical protein
MYDLYVDTAAICAISWLGCALLFWRRTAHNTRDGADFLYRVITTLKEANNGQQREIDRLRGELERRESTETENVI